MSYDPEGLRRVAGAPPHDGDCWDNEWVIAQLRAHADALEENARLKGAWGASALAENARLKAAWDASHKQAMKNGAACNEWRDRAERAEAELAKLRHAVDLAARAMGGEDVNDQGEAWDKCLRILDAARTDFPEGTK